MTWIHTYSDRAFDILAPSAADVCAADLARSQAYQCRFTGHPRRHWSTAQHAIVIAAVIWHRTHDRIATSHGLLHDAGEVYTGDMPAPYKAALRARAPALLEAMAEINRGIDRAIWEWAGIGAPSEDVGDLIDELDKGTELALERALLFGAPPRPWLTDELGIQPIGPGDVGDVFGGAVWNALTASWDQDTAEAAYRVALHRCLPADRPGATTAPHVQPPRWLATALAIALPPPSNG